MKWNENERLKSFVKFLTTNLRFRFEYSMIRSLATSIFFWSEGSFAPKPGFAGEKEIGPICDGARPTYFFLDFYLTLRKLTWIGPGPMGDQWSKNPKRNKGGGWLTSPRWWSEAKQESSARKRFEADPHPTSDRDPRAQGMAREGEASGWGTPSRYNVYNVLKIQVIKAIIRQFVIKHYKQIAES